jgi:hypothetical protein
MTSQSRRSVLRSAVQTAAGLSLGAFGARALLAQAPAHTAGAALGADFQLLKAGQVNVLAVGDAVYGAGWPSIDWWTGGWIGGLVGGLDMLLSVANEDTRFVPARGPVLGFNDLRRQYEMYATIWERLAKKLYGGGSPDEAVAAKPTQEFDDIMGPSEEFVRRAFQSLWAYLSPDA